MRYPNMYDELREHIRVLADRDYQMRAWVKGNYPPGILLDNLDLIVDFLFDDTRLADDPESAIGWYLKNKAEASAVKKIMDRLDKILDDHVGLTDEEYISLDEWTGVVEAAQEAVRVFEPDAPTVEGEPRRRVDPPST